MAGTPLKLFALAVLYSGLAGATILTESFASATQKDATSTAVWNIASGTVHPNLKNAGYGMASSDSTVGFTVGDGSDGVFNSSTYANFGTVVGNTITINALAFPVLNFTSFQLDNPYTLTIENGPLVIYSLSTVTIGGTILCSGVNGSPASAASGGGGGTSRCGGNPGGAGGNSGASGTQGTPTLAAISGGFGAVFGAGAAGSGGGGGGAVSAANGGFGQPGTGGTAGAGGNSIPDDDFSVLTASAGGGGGSGSDTEGGGGGGGSGGTVVIHAVGNVLVSATGSVLARGGNGGAAVSGGGGGGGGGGSIKIFSGGTINLVPGGFPVDATEGTGSVPTTGAAGDGGAGSTGRTWLAVPNELTDLQGAGVENPNTSLGFRGSVQYETTPQTAISKSYDTGTALAIYNAVTFNPASTDVALQIAGSSDNFAVDDTGWLNASQVASLLNKRFVKFKLILTNSNSVVPTQIADVSVDFTAGTAPTPASPTIEEFKFNSGCGTVARGIPLPGNQAPLIMLLFLLPLLVARRLKTVKAKK